MKNLLFLFLFFFSMTLGAQDDDNSYDMFQNILLTPDDGHRGELIAALKAHNDKYHKEGTESVNVWAIRSGPRSGSLLWSKGPMTWTDMDSPIEDENHLKDWRDNILAHADMGPTEFWRLSNNMNYMPEGFVPKLFVARTFDIKSNKSSNARRLWKNHFKVYNELNWDTGLQIYNNVANAGEGKDWSILWFHDSWASMDKDRNFWDTYEEMFGMDRSEWFEEWNDTAKFTGMEIFVFLPELSIGSSN